MWRDVKFAVRGLLKAPGFAAIAILTLALLWMPLRLTEKENPRGSFDFTPVGRLKKGVTLAQANAELAVFAKNEERAHADIYSGSVYHATLLRELITRDSRTRALLLMGAVLFVQLIARTNVTNLLLARSATRTQEIGVRMALGAQARDVLSLVTLQGLRLIGLGLLIGVAGAYFMMQLLRGTLEQISAHDPLTFILLPLLLLVVGLLACYLPARSAMRLDPVEALRYE